MRSDSPFIQSGLTLLSELTDADLDWFLSAGKREKVPANSVVVSEGTEVRAVYVVLQGLLSVYLASRGKELATLGAGQIFGEMSYLEDRPASATVRTLEDSELLTVLRPALDAQLQKNPAFAGRFYRTLAKVTSRRLREMVGAVGRWLEDQPPIEPATLERWNDIAEKTQRFKELLLRIDKDSANAVELADKELPNAFRDFCEFSNQAIGEASPETIDARDELGARVQRELLPYFLKSRTVERLYTKPRGYAGDFRTTDYMIRNEASGTEDSGLIFDRKFLDLPPVAAIRNRSGLITEEIIQTPGAFKFAALCSGTCDEIFAACEGSRRRTDLNATAIDFDAQALAAVAEKRDKLNLTEAIALLNTNLFDLAIGRPPTDLPLQDLVYSINLPDHFDDNLLIKFLNYMHRLLKPGGKAILTSFHAGNPYKAFMDYIVDWKVTHRTEEEMAAIFSRSAFQQPCTDIRFEKEGIIFLAECRKN